MKYCSLVFVLAVGYSAVAVSAPEVAAEKVSTEQQVAVQEEKAPVQEKEKSDRNRWYVSPGIGIMVIQNPVDNEPVFFDLKLGYDLTDRWSIEGGMMYAPLVSSRTESKADQIAGPSLDVLYHFLEPYSRWDVYASAGLAYMFADGVIFHAGDDSGLLPRVGLGVAYHLTDDLSIRLDGKVGIPTEAQTDSFERNLVESLELGLLYRFGGEKSEKAPEVVPVAQEVSPVVVDVTPEDAKDVMILETYINFDYDQSIIKQQYYVPLNDIVRMIQKAKAKNPNVKVSIEGHADRRHKSDAKYNQKLSETRANAVMKHFAEQGVDTAAMSAVGYGFTRPKVTPDLDNGNPENRRVDVYIHGVGDKASRDEIKAK